MKASIVIELLTKGLDKARSTEKALKNIGRAAGGAERDASGLARAESRIGDAGNKAAAGQNRLAASVNKSSSEMRRAKTEAQAYERQMDRLGRQRARLPHGNPNAAGLGGMHVPGGVGMAFLGGLGVGVGGAAGLGYMAKATLEKSSEIEFARDQLQVLGEYSDEQAALYDKILKPSGVRHGVGTIGAYGVFGNLMAGGLNAGNAAKMTDDVIVFAKATQTATDDAAKTAVALQNNMNITAGGLMKAFDVMAIGGKDGQFEVRDMARNAPSILAKMGKLGASGEAGVLSFTAMAQAIRATAGTSDEAATNFENMLDKFTSSDFIKNADELGINVKKVLSKAKKEGLEPTLELVKEIAKATKGDTFKLKDLMPDVQSNSALSAVIAKLAEMDAAIARYGNASGTVLRDHKVATDNATEAWNRFGENVSTKATNIATKVLPSLTKGMNMLSEAMETGKIKAGEPQQVKVAGDSNPDVKAAVASGNERGARLNRFFENLMGFEPSAASKALDKSDAATDFHRYRAASTPARATEQEVPNADGSVSARPWQKPQIDTTDDGSVSLRPEQRQTMPALAKPATSESGMFDFLTDRKFWLGKAAEGGSLKDHLQVSRAQPASYADRAKAAPGNSSAEPIEARGGTKSAPIKGPEVKVPPIDASNLADGMREGGQKAEMAAKATSAAIEATLSAIPLFGAGLKAGMQFAEGLKASAASVAAAANAALVAPVADRVPQSPAKIGPLRNLPSMGRKIAAQLAGGIAGEKSPAEAAHRLAGDISSAAARAEAHSEKRAQTAGMGHKPAASRQDDEAQKQAMTVDRAMSADNDTAPSLPNIGRMIADQMARGMGRLQRPATDRSTAAKVVPPTILNLHEARADIVAPEVFGRDPVKQTRRDWSRNAASRGLDRPQTKPSETNSEVVHRDSPIDIDRRLASLISERPSADRGTAAQVVPPAVLNRPETRVDIVAPEMFGRDPVEKTRRERSRNAASRGLDRPQAKQIKPKSEAVHRDNPVDAARRLASLISDRPKEAPAQRQATSSAAKGKPVSVTIGSIVLHGVKDAAAGVGKIGVMLERQLAGTVGDVGAG